ncbi:MAG: GbsR/MarR family transcriptional regulator [Flavobacteriales bacterium]
MKDIKERVEELGVLVERFGRTPLEARVFSYLLLSEPPYRSFDDIREFLQASKSAVSNALSVLQRDDSVTYKTFSGDRKRYFMVNVKEWDKKLMNSARNLSAFNVLLSEVLDYRKGSEHQEFNNDIQNLFDFQVYLSQEIDKAIEAWKSK